MEPSDDRISELPWEILDNILGRLPIKTTVSTAILSTNWRDKWINVSKLVFDDYSIPPYFGPDELARIVRSVLLSHCGTIETFIYTTQSSYRTADLDTWISLLRKRGVKELTWEFQSDYRLPPCFFSLDVLKHLSLANCWSEVPHKFTVFKGLVSLELKKFTAGSIIQDLINNCSHLEKLVLLEIRFKFLHTSAPNLKYLYVEGEFKNVYLENSPHLTDASFKMTTETDVDHELLSCKVQFPDWISLIRKLALSGYYLRYLAASCIWRGINIACDKLEVVDLDGLHFDQLEEMSLAFSILMCSSKLKELHIKGSGHIKEDFKKFVQGLAQVSCCFKQLSMVKIEITRDRDAEDDRNRGSYLDIIKLVLAHAPVLEEVHVHYSHSEKSDSWFKKKLVKCSTRASSKFKLVYTSTHVPPPQYFFLGESDVDWSLGVNYGYW